MIYLIIKRMIEMLKIHFKLLRLSAERNQIRTIKYEYFRNHMALKRRDFSPKYSFKKLTKAPMIICVCDKHDDGDDVFLPYISGTWKLLTCLPCPPNISCPRVTFLPSGFQVEFHSSLIQILLQKT